MDLDERPFTMTNQEIFEIARQQSAYDCNCKPDDFLQSENIVVRSKKDPRARKYLPLPLACDLVSYGNNTVAQVSERLFDAVYGYIERFPAPRCFETPHLYELNDILKPFGQKICFMAEYFLPDTALLKALPCACRVEILHPPDFAELYMDLWSNALSKTRREDDVLAVGAYDGDQLIGLAGCSADCQTMYQIGVDVLPVYRNRGIASALTSRLACEILAIGKVPFYCAAWSNVGSVRNAIRSGFRPAWVEVTARGCEFVDQLNK